MVKVRDSLPLVKNSQQSAHYNEDSVQLAVHLANYQSPNEQIDLPVWLHNIQKRTNIPRLAQLEQAAALIKALPVNKIGQRSSAFLTGIGLADIIAYLYPDDNTLAAAMLFRAAREKLITIEQIQSEFDPNVAELVSGTLAMGQLSETIEKNKRLEDHFNNNQRHHLTGIYKMLLSVTNDVRVVLIKLAERTFAMRELVNASTERQQRVAREVMTIYAPLAHRLGIAQLKWELEDFSLRFLAPDRYKEIAKLLSEKRSEREAYIERIIEQINHKLAEEGIEANVFGRVKHIYSIYSKMKRKGLSFDQLYDIRAIRILVNTQAECYYVLGIVHSMWRYIQEQFDDYITNPKPNGYRSLHTAVIAESKSLEVQIRTHQMHYEAELGMCAHVSYKEGTTNKDTHFDGKLNSLRQLLSTPNQSEDDEIPLDDWNEMSRIYVFTRDGDIVDLPDGATVLDFAYHVHTEIGNHCQAARVNQRYVPLTFQLKTGQQVEIITSATREPNRDWLVESLGYIHSSRARSNLRHWFRQQDRSKNIEIGQKMLTGELKRLALHPQSIDLNDYVGLLGLQNPDDILVGLATGDIRLEKLTQHISRQIMDEPHTADDQFVPSIHPKATGQLDVHKITIDGIDNIQLTLAGCCQPVFGDAITGYITMTTGASVHRDDCAELARLREQAPERIVSAAWTAKQDHLQPVKIHIEAYDRRGLLKDLAQTIDQEGVNIIQVNTISESDGLAYMTIHIEVSGINHLSRLLAKLEQQPGIISAQRQIATYA